MPALLTRMSRPPRSRDGLRRWPAPSSSSAVTSSGTNSAAPPDFAQRVGGRLAEVLADVADHHRRPGPGQRLAPSPRRDREPRRLPGPCARSGRTRSSASPPRDGAVGRSAGAMRRRSHCHEIWTVVKTFLDSCQDCSGPSADAEIQLVRVARASRRERREAAVTEVAHVADETRVAARSGADEVRGVETNRERIRAGRWTSSPSAGRSLPPPRCRPWPSSATRAPACARSRRTPSSPTACCTTTSATSSTCSPTAYASTRPPASPATTRSWPPPARPSSSSASSAPRWRRPCATDAPMHRLWYDLRNQTLFDESFRADVLEIDQRREQMIWRVISRYAELRRDRRRPLPRRGLRDARRPVPASPAASAGRNEDAADDLAANVVRSSTP